MKFHLRTCLTLLLAASSFGLAAQQATGTLTGVVVTDETPAVPVPRAIVTLSGGGFLYERAAITDGNGRFTFAGLPAGRFTLTASKAAYVTTAYGAKRPGRPGTPFNIGPGERTTVTLPIVRGAVLTGTIRDHAGDPAAGATVMAIRADHLSGRGAVRNDQPSYKTDDRGVYRIYGLAPGDYVLVATAPVGVSAVRMSSAEIDTLLRQLEGARSGQRAAALPGLAQSSVAPVFFPGTPVSSEAARITLAAGEERSADLAIGLVRTATIEGVVTGAGASPPPIGLSLTADGLALPFGMGSGMGRVQQADADGRFRFTSVAPGRYTISARSVSPKSLPARGTGSSMTTSVGGAPAHPTDVPLLFGSTEVSVSGSDVSGVGVLLQPGMTLSGRFVFDAATATPPADLSTLRVRLIAPNAPGEVVVMNGIMVTRFAVPPGSAKADGTFEVTGIMPGTYLVSSSGAPNNWWLRSAVISGRDALDGPIEISQGADVGGAVLTYTDRRNILNGTLQTSGGAPASEFFVVVFPADRTMWRQGARRIQSTRPGTDGRFMVRDLPAGEYFVAALTDVEPSDLEDAAFLDQITAAAVRTTIVEGETRTADLRIRF